LKARLYIFFLVAFCLLHSSPAIAGDAALEGLIESALKNNPGILASEARVAASGFRPSQVMTLPDPMFMIGYQNEGFSRYTLGEEQGAQWMFSVSQMLPYPGKLPLKGEMAERDSAALAASHRMLKLKTEARVRELYLDLFMAYKDIDLIKERAALFEKIEDAALARYSSGAGMQQDVLMAQTEKYMLLEKEEMFRQKIGTAEAMLNAVVGRSVDSSIARPQEPVKSNLDMEMKSMIDMVAANSPDTAVMQNMIKAAELRVRMAEKEFYPDFTVTANYAKRGGPFLDMWSMTTAVNVPIYYKTKQRQAVREAEASLLEARERLSETRLMLASSVRDNYTMAMTAERLMELYVNGLIPKTYQDFESAVAGYSAGRGEALPVISKLKAVIDYETNYWTQFVEREKAIARLHALAGRNAAATGEK